MRRDLAEKIAALNPAFVRFPGGCLVNTGSHYGYEAPNWERRRSCQWKDTIGPVEQRATNANFWGYNQSYGLGYDEYFQFAEDIGAMALPVVPALVTGCGENQATDDHALLARHIRDTLDLIEFANGPPTPRGAAGAPSWATRSRSASPTSASATRRTSPTRFFAGFTRFRDAIEARYPDITVISNSGPDDAGANFDRLWQLNRRLQVLHGGPAAVTSADPSDDVLLMSGITKSFPGVTALRDVTLSVRRGSPRDLRGERRGPVDADEDPLRGAPARGRTPERWSSTDCRARSPASATARPGAS